MKLKNLSRWTVDRPRHSYCGTMTLKPGDRLHVEACALGPFFCSGNDWRCVAGSAQRAKPNRDHKFVIAAPVHEAAATFTRSTALLRA